MHKTRSEILNYIRHFADKAHGQQLRKYTGERYIAHPVRVMQTVGEYNDDICVLAGALLHDVLEDTPVKAHEMEIVLLQVLEPSDVRKVLQLVTELTDIFVKKDFPKLSRRARKAKEAQRLSSVSRDAQSIKYADIIDNVTDIVSQDADFAGVFIREAQDSLRVMKNGDAVLRDRAIKLVDGCLATLRCMPMQSA